MTNKTNSQKRTAAEGRQTLHLEGGMRK